MATSTSSVTDLLTNDSLQNDNNTSADSLTEPLLVQQQQQQQQQQESEGSSSPVDDDNEGQGRVQMSAFFYFTVSVVCVPMFLFGFNTGVLNAPESVIFPSHSVFEWSIAVSAFCAGGFFGANVTGRISDKFGRRKSLIVILVSNLIFGLLHSLSPNMKILIIARFGIGLAGEASLVRKCFLCQYFLHPGRTDHRCHRPAWLRCIECIVGDRQASEHGICDRGAPQGHRISFLQ